MKYPAVALAWHSWRLSRRWYLVMLAVALALHFTIMNLVPPGMKDVANIRELFAPQALMLNMFLAMFTTLVAVSLGGRTGFPLRFEFRMPVSAALLAGIPMLTLALLCMSLFVIPVLLGRIIFDLPMPLLAGAAVIGTTAMLLAAASWIMTGATARGMALVLALVLGGKLLNWLQPFHFPTGARRVSRAFNPDLIALSAAGYAQLALVVLVLYALTVSGIRLQRQNEPWRLLPAVRRAKAPGTRRKFRDIVEIYRDLFRVPCPVSSPWAAQLWFEFKGYGMPVLALGAVLALMMPVLPLADSLFGVSISVALATALPLVLFFTGIGIGIVNRRAVGGGYMNPFEGTRGLGTAQMAGIQLGSLGATMAVGVALMAASLWMSASLYGDLGLIWSRGVRLVDALREAAFVQQVGICVVVLACFFSLITFFLCLHSCSLFWGRKVMYGTFAFVIYAGLATLGLLTNENNRDFIVKNMWGIAGLVTALTALLATRVAALRLLSLTTAAMGLLVWVVFLACALVTFQSQGIQVLAQEPELQAFNGALLTLPVTLFLGTVWCYDRLRHR